MENGERLSAPIAASHWALSLSLSLSAWPAASHHSDRQPNPTCHSDGAVELVDGEEGGSRSKLTTQVYQVTILPPSYMFQYKPL